MVRLFRLLARLLRRAQSVLGKMEQSSTHYPVNSAT